jgi:O-acetyl-ADP-ribose deacetylase (regulator of RNase III)
VAANEELRRKVAANKARFEQLSVEAKRKLYMCVAEDYTTVERDTKPWSEVGKKFPTKPGETSFATDESLNSQIRIYTGDITRLEVHAVVNAANEACLGGSGVDGAIHKAAGKELLDECRLLRGCPTGQAKVTAGYRLPASAIIHAVGPKGKKPKLLRETYESALKAALDSGFKTVAFSCISTGIYGFPSDAAAVTVTECLRHFLETQPGAEKLEAIVVCLFEPKDANAYGDALPKVFPVSFLASSARAAGRTRGKAKKAAAVEG